MFESFLFELIEFEEDSEAKYLHMYLEKYSNKVFIAPINILENAYRNKCFQFI